MLTTRECIARGLAIGREPLLTPTLGAKVLPRFERPDGVGVVGAAVAEQSAWRRRAAADRTAGATA